MSAKLRTAKQREIVNLVLTMNDAGHATTYEDFFELLSYGRGLSRQALICSTGILIRKGYLTRTNDGKNIARFNATNLARTTLRPDSDLSQPEPHSDIDSIL